MNNDNDNSTQAVSQAKQTHSFPLDIAKRTGSATDAIVLRAIAFWIGHKLQIKDGKQWGYCSTSRLAKSLPYLGPMTINDSIRRLEGAGLLSVKHTGKYNRASYDKTLWFHIDVRIAVGATSRKGCVSYSIADAVNYGVPAALVLQNLRFSESKTKPACTVDGYGFRHVRPTYLAAYFGCMSPKSIERGLADLLEKGELIKHPEKRVLYRLKDQKRETSMPTNPYGKPTNPYDNTTGNKLESLSYAVEDGCAPSTLPRKPSGIHWLLAHAQKAVRNMKPIQWINTASIGQDDQWAVYETCGTYDREAMNEIALDRHATCKVDDLQYYFSNPYGHLPKAIKCTKADRKQFYKLFRDNPHLASEDLERAYTQCLIVQRNQEDSSVITAGEGLSFDCPVIQSHQFDRRMFPRKAKTAKYFLQWLPEILAQLQFFDEPYCQIDFAYLGKGRKNKVVTICDYDTGEGYITARQWR